MKTRYAFNIQDFDAFSGTAINSIIFQRCENSVGFKEEYSNFLSFIIYNISSTGYEISIYVNDQSVVFTNANITDLIVSDDGSFKFDAEVTGTSVSKILTLYQRDAILFNQDGRTTLFAYRQNSDNNHLSKDLTNVMIFDGKFNNSVNLKNIIIDISGYYFGYNYIFIHKLNRYYYVSSVDLITADFTRLHLKEDVLMSWKDLIKQQEMQITRYEHSDENFIVDDRLPLESRYSVQYKTIFPTTTGNLTNCTLNYSIGSNERNYLVTTITTRASDNVSSVYGATKPTGTLLPDISPRKPLNKHHYVLSYSAYLYFVNACLKNTNLADSFIVSSIWLPFVPRSTNGFHITQNATLKVGDSLALSDHENGDFANDVHYSYIEVDEILDGVSPYLITHDFKFGDADTFLEYSPYAIYEIYIAFVGWVKLDMTQLFNHRCIIYYTIDFESGTATAFLYDMSTLKLIFSQQCNMSLVNDIITSNKWENDRQKMMVGMNMAFNTISNGISAVASASAGNYGKTASSMVGTAKSLIMSEKQAELIKDTMTSSTGSPENALYTPITPVIRVFYRAIIPQLDVEGDWSLDEYHKLQGKPYNKYYDGRTIELTGYLEAGVIHFNPKGNSIYQDEISEIVSLLQDGVVF